MGGVLQAGKPGLSDAEPRKRRVLVLVTDAFGGHGGIALYGRDVLTALCMDPAVESVTALPRIAALPINQPMPDNLDFDLSGLGGQHKYIAALARIMILGGPFDLIFTTHLNLLPLARIAGWIKRAPVLVTLHGIEAWEPSQSRTRRWFARSADHIVAVSKLTLDRFSSWAAYPPEACSFMPNGIHLDRYNVQPKNRVLEDRYGLTGRKVIMTVGRLAGSERYKGFDETLQAMPLLLKQRGDVAYLIVGDGSDRERLEKKAQSLGLADNVVFAGYVDEAEKADIFRLADVYVMPSRGEGFGYVLLEAMACGIPVIASTRDGTREAVRDGQLGAIVDPQDRPEIVAAILAGLERPRERPEGLDYFAFPNFVERLNALTGQLMARHGQ